MDSRLPPLAGGLMSAAVRDFMHRDTKHAAAGHLRLPRWPVAAVLAAVSFAWSINSMDWDFGDTRVMIAIGTGSLVATVALVVGWASEPEEIERWVLRALAATSISVLPLFS